MRDRATVGSKRWRRLWRDARGQSTVASFPWIATVFILLLGLATFVAKIRAPQVTVASAARVCVRQAVETLDQERGLAQAQEAALSGLRAWHLDPRRATVNLTVFGPWDQGTEVECRVAYTVALDNIPFLALFSPDREKAISAAYRLQIQPYKSEWQ